MRPGPARGRDAGRHRACGDDRAVAGIGERPTGDRAGTGRSGEDARADGGAARDDDPDRPRTGRRAADERRRVRAGAERERRSRQRDERDQAARHRRRARQAICPAVQIRRTANSLRSVDSGSASATCTPPTAAPIEASPITRALPPAHEAVLLLAPDADDHGGDDGEQGRRLRVQLRQAERRQRGHEQDPSADAEQAGEHAGDDAENRCQHVRHWSSSLTAIPTSSAAKRNDSVRTGKRC